MASDQIKTTINEADQLLTSAQNELFKAQEDVVPYLVCHNARLSISNYLIGYLMGKGIKVEPDTEMEALLDRCKEESPAFENLSLGPMNCSSDSHSEHFCTDINKVRICVELAEKTQKLVTEDVWPLSKRIK